MTKVIVAIVAAISPIVMMGCGSGYDLSNPEDAVFRFFREDGQEVNGAITLDGKFSPATANIAVLVHNPHSNSLRLKVDVFYPRGVWGSIDQFSNSGKRREILSKLIIPPGDSRLEWGIAANSRPPKEEKLIFSFIGSQSKMFRFPIEIIGAD